MPKRERSEAKTSHGELLPILALVGGRGGDVGVAPITMLGLPFTLGSDLLFGSGRRNLQVHRPQHILLTLGGFLLEDMSFIGTVLVETKGLLCLFLELLEPIGRASCRERV